MVKVLWLCMVIALPYFAQSQILLPHSKDGKFGFVNQRGNWVIRPTFDRVKSFKGDVTTGVLNDSVYLINKNGIVSFVDQVKDMQFFSNGKIAMQDFGGKWAFADKDFKLLSDYKYSSIVESYKSFIVTNDGLMGMLDSNLQIALDIKFNALRHINQYFVFGRISKVNYYYSTHGGIKELPTTYSKMTYDVQPFNLVLISKVESCIFNLKGDSIYTCNNCSINGSIKDMLLVVQDDYPDQKVIGAEDGTLLHHSVDTMSIFVDIKNELMFDPANKKLLLEVHPKTNFFDTLKVESYQKVDSINLSIVANGLCGVVTLSGEVIVPFKYMSISELSGNALLCRDEKGYYIAKKSSGEFIYSLKSFSAIQATDNTILITNSSNGATMLGLDKNVNIIDSFKMSDFSIVNVGRRTDVANAGTFITQGNNTSRSQRWYFDTRRNRFGLLGALDKDTLIKPKFNSIRGMNDSIDFVEVLSSRFSVMNVKGMGTISLYSRYGIVNNRTGKYLMPPVFPFVDFNMLGLSSTSVITVILPNGKYCLYDLKNFTLLKSTICDFIAPEHNNYVRLFYQPTFVVSNHKMVVKNPRYKLIISASEFSSRWGNIRQNTDIVGFARAVNIANLNGELLLNKTQSENIAYIDPGKYGKFICYNQKDSAGVFSSKDGFVVSYSFAKIWRLLQNDSFFVCQKTNVRYGYINDEGDEITNPIYTYCLDFNDGYAWSRIHDNNYIVDRNGKDELIYSGRLKVKNISKGITAKMVNKGWQIVDVSGVPIVEEVFKNAMPFSDGMGAVQTKKGWGIIASNGSWLVEPSYKIYVAQTAYSIVLSDEKNCFFFDQSGKLTETRKLKGNLKNFNDSMFVETLSNANVYYYADGSKFDKGKKYKAQLMKRHDSLFVIKEKKVLVLNENGKVEDKLNHQKGYKYVKKGVMEVKSRDKYSKILDVKIMPSYKVLDPNIFDSLTTSFVIHSPNLQIKASLKNEFLQHCYQNNAFVFRLGNKMVLSDSLGAILADENFMDISFLNDIYYKVTLFNEHGFLVSGVIDKFGMWIVPAKYNYIGKFTEQLAIYGMYRSFYIANNDGRFICPFELMDFVSDNGYIHLITDVGSAWWKPDGTFVTGFDR